MSLATLLLPMCSTCLGLQYIHHHEPATSSAEPPHWSHFSWVHACWNPGTVGPEWYPCCRLQPATQTPPQPDHTETPTHMDPRTIRPMWQLNRKSRNVNEMGSHWVLSLLYLNIVLSWPEDGWLRPKHIARYNLIVIIASCLDVCCVLTVHNILYIFDTHNGTASLKVVYLICAESVFVS
jgi:hypothetical protein